MYVKIMEVEISEDITRHIDKASQAFGLNQQEFVLRAVRFYLNSIMEEEYLREELEVWEKAGIEDLEHFETTL